MTDETLPEPDGYYYEWDGPYGKRKFTPAPHNGSQCDRAVAYYTVATLREAVKRAKEDERAAIAEKLRRAGATLPAPEAKGTIESAMQTGLCIALAIVEHQEESQ